MLQWFDLPDVNKAASTFNPKKLRWLNQQYLKASDPAHVARHLSWHIGQLGIDPSQGPALTEVVEAFRERTETLQEMAQACAFCYREFAAYDEKAAAKHLTAEAAVALARLRAGLAPLEEWRAGPIHALLGQIAGKLGLALGKVAQPLRVAVTGTAVSPPIDVTLELLGRQRTLQRLDRALAFSRGPAGG
jgi:glutamyl-tRNA synthetase